MKYIFTLLMAVLLLMPLTNSVLAQVGDEDEDEEKWERYPYRFTVSVDGGIGIPFEPANFDALWNEALISSVSFGVVIIPRIEIRGWFVITSWGISEIPAHDALQLTGIQESRGGTILTMLYGAAARIYPLPESQMMPFVEVGGGFFQASAEDMTVDERPQNSMEDASGPAFLVGGGMEYGLNETWNVFAQFNYYIGFSSDFNPGELVRPRNSTEEITGGDMHIGAILLGLTLKF